jgi:hypothetical protein
LGRWQQALSTVATGTVHRGTLKPGISDGAMPLDVVVKLAFDVEQRDALKSEYNVYCYLRSKGILRGIATPLGFFDDSEGGACALVMLYAGVPLIAVPRRNLSYAALTCTLVTLQSKGSINPLSGRFRASFRFVDLVMPGQKILGQHFIWANLPGHPEISQRSKLFGGFIRLSKNVKKISSSTFFFLTATLNLQRRIVKIKDSD